SKFLSSIESMQSHASPHVCPVPHFRQPGSRCQAANHAASELIRQKSGSAGRLHPLLLVCCVEAAEFHRRGCRALVVRAFRQAAAVVPASSAVSRRRVFNATSRYGLSWPANSPSKSLFSVSSSMRLRSRKSKRCSSDDAATFCSSEKSWRRYVTSARTTRSAGGLRGL